MAKHCEHCNSPYADDLEACPKCGRPAAAVEGVEAEAEALLVDQEPEAEGEAILVDDHGSEPPPGATEEVVDLADVHVLHQETGDASDVALVHEPNEPEEGGSDLGLVLGALPTGGSSSDVALVQGEPGAADTGAPGAPRTHKPVPASEDWNIDLRNPADPLVGERGTAAPQGAPSEAAWAEMAASADKPAAEGEEIVVEPVSDRDLLGKGPGAPPMELEEPVPVVEAEEEAEAIVVKEDSQAVIDLGAVETPAAGEHAEGPSAVNLTGAGQDTLPVSDLNLVAEAMEPGASVVYLGDKAGTPEDADSAIDLSADEAGSGSASSVDLTAMGGPAGDNRSGSGLNLAELGAVEPAAEGEVVEEWATERSDEAVPLEETVAFEGPPSARDIVEEVESGVDLAEAARAESHEETVNLQGAEEGGDSAIDLGAPGPQEVEGEAPAEALGETVGTDSGLMMRAMQEEGVPAESEMAEEPAATEEEGPSEGMAEEPSAEPAPAPRSAGKAVPMAGGWLLGAAMTAAAAAALWFFDLLPARTPTRPAAPGRPAVAEAPTLEGAHGRLASGDYQEALKLFGQLEQGNTDNPGLLASRGEALWLSSLQQLAAEKKPLTRDELTKIPEVARAKEDLTKASGQNPDALYWLGEIQGLMDGPDAARATYQKGLQQFPTQKQRFQAALDALDINAPEKGAAGARLTPEPGSSVAAYWRAVALIALQGQPPAGGGQPMPPQGGGAQPPAGDQPGAGATSPEDEAGYHFLQAVKLAQQNKYTEALAALKEARSLHEQRRFSRLRKAQNPLSDPTEQIFLRACDELTVFWQIREKLAESDLLARDKRATPAEILQAMTKLTGAAKELVTQLKAENYDTSNLASAVKQLLEDKTKAQSDRKSESKRIADILAALKEANVKSDDALTGVQELEKIRKAKEKQLDDVLAALKTAGVKADDPVKGVADLDGLKKAEEKKLATVLTLVKDAGIKADDPIRAVEAAVADRKEANDTVDNVRKQLVGHKYLPATSTRPDVPKGVEHVLHDVDHPVVVALTNLADDLSGLGGKVGQEVAQALNMQRRLTTAQLEITRLDALLGERWTPEQMMDVWLVLLRDPANKGLAPRALRDVQGVLNEKPMPAAVCVKGLAERSQGQFDSARKDLKSIEDAPGDPNAPWRKVVRTSLGELTDSSVAYVPRIRQLRAERKYGEALGTVEEALRAFPQQTFPQDNAGLMALRSIVRLDQAYADGTALPPDALKDSQQDASAAVAGGEMIEGKYAQGRLAEATGDLARAEALYREAVKAYEGAEREDFHRKHPVSDPAGNRYRAALTRVLLDSVRRARPAPAEAAPPAPREGSRTGRNTGGATTTAAADTTTTRSTGFALWAGGAPHSYLMPFLMMQQPPAGAGVEEAEAPDPRLQEALEQADKLIAAGDARGYLLKGEILARQHRWNDGLKTIDAGVQRLLPAGESTHIRFLLENHPAFQRREGLKPPDPVLAEEYYAAGLREYFDGNYVAAERDFSDASTYYDQDARYLYFLGLARLPQSGKRDQALEDFRQAGRLEQLNKPSPAAVSVALERVQGPARHLLNRIREDAIREVTSKQP
jgi:tetratricopeptide (TPR) repeat protein